MEVSLARILSSVEGGLRNCKKFFLYRARELRAYRAGLIPASSVKDINLKQKIGVLFVPAQSCGGRQTQHWPLKGVDGVLEVSKNRPKIAYTGRLAEQSFDATGVGTGALSYAK